MTDPAAHQGLTECRGLPARGRAWFYPAAVFAPAVIISAAILSSSLRGLSLSIERAHAGVQPWSLPTAGRPRADRMLAGDEIVQPGDIVEVVTIGLIGPNQQTKRISRIGKRGTITLAWIGEVKIAGKSVNSLDYEVAHACREAGLEDNGTTYIVMAWR